MAIDIKPRHIRVLRELPVSEMTDEEIVKAAMDRLQTKSAMLGYLNDDMRWQFIYYHKNGYRAAVRGLINHIKDWFNCAWMKEREEE